MISRLVVRMPHPVYFFSMGRNQKTRRRRDSPIDARRTKLRAAIVAATAVVVISGVIAAFAAAGGPGRRAVIPQPASADPPAGGAAAQTAPSALDAVAAAVGFHLVLDPSAGNVERLPADAGLLPPSAGLLPVGEVAPDFDLSTPQGGSTRLSRYRGKTVLLEFFATWCPHCQAEIPHLEALRSALAGAPVVFLSVNADSEDAASVRAFEKYFSLPWPALLDPGGRPGSFTQSGGFGSVSTAYGVAMYPTFYIISPDGRVAWRADREQPDALILKELRAVSGG